MLRLYKDGLRRYKYICTGQFILIFGRSIHLHAKPPCCPLVTAFRKFGCTVSYRPFFIIDLLYFTFSVRRYAFCSSVMR
jgi:hypothetical protein